MSDESWFSARGVEMTQNQRTVYDLMTRYEEGLGPRAYACLLQLDAGRQPNERDREWLTDGVEEPALARIAEDGRCVLTAYGRLLADAANRGDFTAMAALTTMPEIIDSEAAR